MTRDKINKMYGIKRILTKEPLHEELTDKEAKEYEEFVKAISEDMRRGKKWN